MEGTIEVRKKRNTLAIIVGNKEVKLHKYQRDNVPFTVLKVLAVQNGGRVVFKSAYEFVLELMKYTKYSTAVEFAREVLDDALPEDLKETIELALASADNPEKSEISLFSREVIDEIMKIREMLNSYHEFSIDEAEVIKALRLGRLHDNVEVAYDVVVPTEIGFTIADEVYIYGDGKVFAPLRGFSRLFYVGNMTLGDLFTLVQAVKSLRIGSDDFLVKFAEASPPVPSELVNPDIAKYAVEGINTYVIALHKMLTWLPGSKMVLPVIEENGVAWRDAKVIGLHVGESEIYVRYKRGKYVGRFVLAPASSTSEYASAMRKLLEKNEEFAEKFRERERAFIQFLKNYENYLIQFETYAKLIL